MRVLQLGLLFTLLVGSALGQALLCPPSATPPSHACDTFHYHVQLYRPDTRGFVELYGVNQFASQAACDRARDAAILRNTAIVDFYRKQRNDQRYEPDRFGPCHCDMTVEKTSSNYLTDALRAVQLKLAADVRQRVRERLMDADVPTDSELIRDPQTTSPLGGPRFVPLPAAPATSTTTNAPGDLKTTKAADLGGGAITADLPLVDPLATAAPVAPVAVAEATPPPKPAPEPAPVPAPPQPQPQPQPQTQPQTQPQPQPPPQPAVEVHAEAPAQVPAAADPEPVEDAGNAFITAETDRIEKVLAASSAISDESVRAKVFEACTQRIQLLSNLRALIEGSGAKSRLASAARAAREESDRLALVAKLFGSDMPQHWAPKDARDVVVDLPAGADRIVRDSNASTEQRRHALYALLATTQLTDDQQLWVGSVIEGLL